MSDYWYEDYESERLLRDAVMALIERHRDEYLDLVKHTHEEQIKQLQEQARRDKRTIKELQEKVEQTLVERDRWRARLEPDGRLVPDR